MKFLTFGQETFLPSAVFVECVEFFIDPMTVVCIVHKRISMPMFIPGKVEFHTVRISWGEEVPIGSTVRRRLGI